MRDSDRGAGEHTDTKTVNVTKTNIVNDTKTDIVNHRYSDDQKVFALSLYHLMVFNQVFIQMYFTPEDFFTFLYDFYHKSLSGTLLVYPRRMKTVVNLQR